ncbi:hypothetical protein K435DRAFT_974889 [Dendrothele bispora CBS 962.96]|uniref:Endonuclease/exonuclease/phosphatase domain-containing protein n=1 Tax=Dendrothele bispora (strain CBS 962.96) TaxID=1314807 RepID=A0A4V4HAF5_DENBC|nr:hypothetical protein K435DRAFT_974889 [Dendrothele bispora CBS 962.96]
MITAATNSTSLQSRLPVGTACSGLPTPGEVSDSSASWNFNEGSRGRSGISVSRREPLGNITNQHEESAQTQSHVGGNNPIPRSQLLQNPNTRGEIMNNMGTRRTENLHSDVDVNHTQTQSTIEIEAQIPRSLPEQLELSLHRQDEAFGNSRNILQELLDEIENINQIRTTHLSNLGLGTQQPETQIHVPRQARREVFRTGRRGKNMKASIKIGSLNIRGYGNPSITHPDNKLNSINQLMREKRLGVLMLQETHMDGERG